MSTAYRLLEEARRRSLANQQLALPTQNPFGPPTPVSGGFLESAFSSIPELFGRDPTPQAVQFRAEHPIAGFTSQVLPAMVPYGGMFALSRTAAGAAALSKGMRGAKATGTALGLNTVNRPVIASAVKEMLRYSPLELGRLGTGAVFYPENVGELFADVALSTMFEGALGGAGGFLRVAGTATRQGIGQRVPGQENMLTHPVTDLRALHLPEAQTAWTPEQIAAEADKIIPDILNDQPIQGFITKKPIPLFNGIEQGAPKDAAFINSLFRPNTAAKKTRHLDKRKLWEGPTDSQTTINPGELEAFTGMLGFKSTRELAENVLQGRVLSTNSAPATGAMNKLFESPGLRKIDDDTWAAQTDFGSSVVFKRLIKGKAAAKKAEPQPAVSSIVPDAEDTRPKVIAAKQLEGKDNAQVATVLRTAGVFDDDVADNVAAGKVGWRDAISRVGYKWTDENTARLKSTPKSRAMKAAKAKPATPAAPEGPWSAGDRWVMVHTDNPSAFSPAMAAMQRGAERTHEALRRVFQPMRHQPHIYNELDDQFIGAFTPLNVASAARQSRKTWVAETLSDLKRRGVNIAGLQDSAALQNYVDKAYEVFVPGMFKERRNTQYARYSALLQNRIRAVNEKVTEAVFGRSELKAGAKGVLNRDFERVGLGGLAARDAVDSLSDDGFSLLVKVNESKTPLKDLQKAAADEAVDQADVALIERLMQIRADFDDQAVIKPLAALGNEHNFNFLEGYINPRVPLGEWSVRVKDGNKLVWLATGKDPKQAQSIAKAIVDEGASRGRNFSVDNPSLRHAVEMNVDDLQLVMKQVAESYSEAPLEFDDIVQSAMKRVRFMGERRGRVMPVNPRAPASLRHERTGIPMNTLEYTRKDFVNALEADMRRKATFSAVATYTDRWGHELLGRLRPQNISLYDDIQRRAQQALGVEGQTTRWMNERLQKVLGPQLGSKAATKIAAATNKGLFAFQLGIANPTYALLNALSPLQTVLPQVAFVLGAPREESARLLQFMPIKDSAGRTVAIGGAMDPIKVMWESVRQIRHADEELQLIHRRLHREGSINPVLYEEQSIKVPQTLKESFQRGGWAEFIYETSTSMARNSESFARIVSANAGYTVGKKHLGLEGEQLYHFTRRFVESTNYLYGQSDRARIITGPIGSMFGLFKNWQMHFMGMIAVYAGVGIKHNTWGPLMWQMGAASALGGLGATPLRHMADGLASFHEEHNDSFLWMQENWGRPWADMAWFGPMGALGVSLQASSTIPGTDVRNDLQMIFSSIVLERGKALTGVVGDGIAHYRTTGENPLADQNLRDRLIAAAAPRAVSRAAAVVEGDYVKSMGTGYPMMREPSYTARFMHGLGMNSVEIERQQVASRVLWKNQEQRKAAITEHGRQMSAALQAGDYDQFDRVQTSAIGQELDLSSVYASAKNFERREAGDLLDRYKSTESWRYRAATE